MLTTHGSFVILHSRYAYLGTQGVRVLYAPPGRGGPWGARPRWVWYPPGPARVEGSVPSYDSMGENGGKIVSILSLLLLDPVPTSCSMTEGEVTRVEK